MSYHLGDGGPLLDQEAGVVVLAAMAPDDERTTEQRQGQHLRSNWLSGWNLGEMWTVDLSGSVCT